MRILVVDDEKEARTLLGKTLTRLDHKVVEATSGIEAWDILEREGISFVISDWMMPRMNGLELCRRVRAAKFENYIYFILLTAKDNKNELIEGMKAGADDFIVKPFNAGELDVRIRAGERVLRLERELQERNKKLIYAYDKIRSDLEAAANMQKSLLPVSATTISSLRFDWIFCPCSFVAGDIFGLFELHENHVGFYLLDVAGHGVPAAMQSVTLNKLLSSIASKNNMWHRYTSNANNCDLTSPSMVIRELNRRFQSDDAMQYFTMVYGVTDVRDGRTKLVQAGHPSPLYQEKEGKVTLLGMGGLPVGMLPHVEHEEHEFYFGPGDRLFLYCDGITECHNGKSTDQFSVERLVRLVEGWRSLPLKELMKGIEQKLRLWRGSEEFEDDITLLAIERA